MTKVRNQTLWILAITAALAPLAYGVLWLYGPITPDSYPDPLGTPPAAVETRPVGAPGSPRAPAPFSEVDKEVGQLVEREATWDAPGRLTVDNVTRIGLLIGSGKRISDEANDLIRDSIKTNAGTVLVGPLMRVTLGADADEAQVTPSVGVDASTGSDIQLLFTWLVRPKHPTAALELTAHIETPLSNGHVIAKDLALRIPVSRTFGYTMGQIFTNWATWSAIGGTVIAVGGWLWRRQRKSHSQAPLTNGGAEATA
jgi:hypothetical protein